MTLTLGPLLVDAGIDPSQALVIRHAFTQDPEENGLQGLHADSTQAEILDYTRKRPPTLSGHGPRTTTVHRWIN